MGEEVQIRLAAMRVLLLTRLTVADITFGPLDKIVQTNCSAVLNSMSGDHTNFVSSQLAIADQKRSRRVEAGNVMGLVLTNLVAAEDMNIITRRASPIRSMGY